VDELDRSHGQVEEAAERLGIGRSLMYRLVLSGEVQSVPVGRLRRIPRDALTEYVDRLRREADATIATHQDRRPSPRTEQVQGQSRGARAEA
jgi:excisionase family DNA binding protein